MSDCIEPAIVQMYDNLERMPVTDKNRMLFETCGLRVAVKGFIGRCTDPRFPGGTELFFADYPRGYVDTQNAYLQDSSKFNVHRYLDPFKFWLDLERGEWCCWGLNHRKWFPLSLMRSQGLAAIIEMAVEAVRPKGEKV